MERYEVLEKLQDIIRDAVDDSEIVITDETTAADVDGWDSLAHLLIIGEIRNEFGVKLSSSEISSLQNVGAMIEAIINRL